VNGTSLNILPIDDKPNRIVPAVFGRAHIDINLLWWTVRKGVDLILSIRPPDLVGRGRLAAG
jgi:hypothetical protein